MTVHRGAVDPARSLRLLWRDSMPDRAKPRHRGPKQALSVDQVISAGIAIADAEGIATLSMRRVAERLGVGTMSLYTYIPAKVELIDAMIDTVYAEALPTTARGGPEPWRLRLEKVARANWDLFRRHPWLMEVPRTRAVVGPNTIAKYDHELQAIDDIGLTPVEMDSVLNLIIAHAEGAARRALDATYIEQQTGMTDLEWWEAVGPLLREVTDPSHYPTAARVGTAVGEAHQAASAPQHEFEFGLKRVLDGVDALVRSRP
jgi:AcrR family transcriptional regulator